MTKSGQGNGTWIENANTCFKNKAFPTTLSNSKTLHQRSGSKLWTGLFQTFVTYKYNSKFSGKDYLRIPVLLYLK